jgi:hypothetical protein
MMYLFCTILFDSAGFVKKTQQIIDSQCYCMHWTMILLRAVFDAIIIIINISSTYVRTGII